MRHQKFYMRKIFLGLVTAGLVLSCQKVQEGSNKSIMRLDHSKTGDMGLPYDPAAQNGERVHNAGSTTSKSAFATDSIRTAPIEEVKVSADSTKSAAPSH